MASRLDGKICVVAGGTQGLGEATARMMAERGAAGIAIVGRSVDLGHQLAGDLTASGCKTIFLDADLSDADECRNIIPAVDAQFGTIQALAVIAAATDRGTIWDTTSEQWDYTMALNVRAPFLLIQGAADLMQRSNSAGSIVSVGSVCGDGGPPNLLPYSVSKGALQSLTKNAAFSLARHQIRVNLIQLGWMNTPAEHNIQTTQEGQPQDWLAAAAAAQPFGRLIDPVEAARAVCYLVSDESGLMTGATLDFDQSVVGAGQAPIPDETITRDHS